MLTPMANTSGYLPTNQWRIRRAEGLRTDMSRPTGDWAARELVYWCTVAAPENAYYVVLRLPLGLQVTAVSPCSGCCVVRLLYDWSERGLHLPAPALSQLVLSELAKEGARLRAAMAYARAHPRP